MRYLNWLLLSLLALVLTGCASDQAQYSMPSTSGVIVAIQPVTEAGGGKIGTLVGAAAGGLGGSQLTHNKKAQVSDAAAGAVLGAVIGDIAEHEMTHKHLFQYVVKTVNGTVITVNQPANPALQINQRVVVIYQDNKPQLIPDNSQPQEYRRHRRYHYDDDDDDED